ncbi:MAG: M14 family zinc carboxypeptidase [Candidatus Caccovivens sp.]
MDYKHLQKFIKANCAFFDVQVIGKSVLGRNIYAINKKFNDDYRWCIITGAIHAREHLSCDLVCHFISKLKNIKHLPYNISFVPLVNPDGVDFAINGIDRYKAETQAKLMKINGGRDFSLFKANANGVDLNNNFDANWDSQFTKIFVPASQGYYGVQFESEPESCALANWTKKISPFFTLSYHLKGEQIYFDFFQEKSAYQRDKKIAKIFAKSTGYKIKSTQKVSSGGYKDWCVHNLKIPALTIELGNDKFNHPFPQIEMEHIYNQNDDIFDNIAKSLKIYEKYASTNRTKKFSFS